VPGLIESIKETIFSEDFLSRHRSSPEAFTRKRALPFHQLIFFLMNMNKGSYQDELDHYFKTLNHLDVAERIVTKGALTKARKKLKYQAFIELNAHMTSRYYSYFQTASWHGFNLMAIDGSTVRLPEETEIMEHFGVWNVKNGDPCPKARISQMFDVLNRVTVDALIKPKKYGERELAAFHFLNLMPNDLILLDRGYPAFWLFKLIITMGADFCARTSCTNWKVIRKFYRSGQKERVIKLDSTPLSSRKCAEMGFDKNPVEVRLIRVELSTGETEVLITTLMDADRYPINIFADLYHRRWPVEEDYKTMKCRMELASFSGKSTLSIYQDFHAKVLSKNFTSIIANTTKDEIDKLSQHRNFQYQINFVQALSNMKHTIVLLFTRPAKQVKLIITKLQKIFSQTVEQVRPGRSFTRKHKVKLKKYHFAYKRIS
jgi:Transposase DDE domain